MTPKCNTQERKSQLKSVVSMSILQFNQSSAGFVNKPSCVIGLKIIVVQIHAEICHVMKLWKLPFSLQIAGSLLAASTISRILLGLEQLHTPSMIQSCKMIPFQKSWRLAKSSILRRIQEYWCPRQCKTIYMHNISGEHPFAPS